MNSRSSMCAKSGNTAERVGIESNHRYYCAWGADRVRECWGEPEPAADALLLGFSPEPFSDMRFGGNTGGIEITDDGSLALWGSDFYGQLSGAPNHVT